MTVVRSTVVVEWEGQSLQSRPRLRRRMALENRACAAVETNTSPHRPAPSGGLGRTKRLGCVSSENWGGSRWLVSGYRRSQPAIFYRFASERTRLPERRKATLGARRTGMRITWRIYAAFRDDVVPAHVQTQLTGRKADAALADPRWKVRA